MLWSVQFFSEFGKVPTTIFSPSFRSGGAPVPGQAADGEEGVPLDDGLAADAWLVRQAENHEVGRALRRVGEAAANRPLVFVETFTRPRHRLARFAKPVQCVPPQVDLREAGLHGQHAGVTHHRGGIIGERPKKAYSETWFRYQAGSVGTITWPVSVSVESWFRTTLAVATALSLGLSRIVTSALP